jgi:pimeloyl-ACP methyl ester carboxylesterase
MPAVEGSSSVLRASLGQAVNAGRLIPAADHHVRLYEEGAGSPVVVIIAGAGDCADSWLPIRHHLAAANRVVSYDRAAIGGSDQAAPATAERYLAELDAVLDAASPQDPVVLAGHSLGGLIARLYQHARPGRVRGLVLLDSTPEAVADDRGVQAGFVASGLAARLLKLLTPLGFTRLLLRWQKMPLYPEQSRYRAAVSPAEYDRWMTMVCASFARGAGAELRSVIPTAAHAKKLLTGHTIPVPVAVIASSAFGGKWVGWQHEIAALSATGSFTFTGTRSHNIHLRHLAAVTAAVGEIASPAGTNTDLSFNER